MNNDVNINKARAIYYNMFAQFFVSSTDISNYFELLKLIEVLKKEPLDNTSKGAFDEVAKLLKADSNFELLSEYDEIFHNPETQNIRTTASFYDEGLESGKKRVEMLQFLAKTKIRRDENRYFEYEDSIGFIFAVLSELSEAIVQGESQYSNTVHCIFEEVLNEFIDEFASSVYSHPKAKIYKEVIVLLKTFVEFERLYLQVSKPAKKEIQNKENFREVEISEEERQRRERNKALRAQGPKQEVCSIDIAYDVETEI